MEERLIKEAEKLLKEVKRYSWHYCDLHIGPHRVDLRAYDEDDRLKHDLTSGRVK